MVANADLEEAEFVQGIFGALDLAEVFRSHGSAVFDARRETGAGGLVSQGQPGFARQGADVLLGQVRGDEWRKSIVQRSGFLAGTELAAIIDVHPVGEVRETKFDAAWLPSGRRVRPCSGSSGCRRCGRSLDLPVLSSGECGSEFHVRRRRSSAAANSRRGNEGESARTASIRSPRA